MIILDCMIDARRKTIFQLPRHAANVKDYIDNQYHVETQRATKSTFDHRFTEDILTLRVMQKTDKISIKWADGDRELSNVQTKKGT